MYRAPRHCLLAGPSVGAATARAARRAYTPIFQPDPATDHVAPLRHADEAQALWATEAAPVASLSRAVRMWLRFGNDPVVHTTAPPQMPDGTWATSPAFPSPSPFAYAEDFFGTNLVAGSGGAQQTRDGAELWSHYFERKYMMRVRQSRRTATQHIGTVGAPETFTDEADSPSTTWDKDTHFREVAFLSARHLKEKVANPLQLEEAIVSRATPEQFLAFFAAYQQETASRVPLPVPAVWVYEGEAQKAWVERYLPVAKAAHAFFRQTLTADVKKLGSPAAVTKAVAGAFKKVHAVMLQRAARQVKEGIRPDWSSPTTTPEQKLEWTRNVHERYYRSILEGDFDPEDLLDGTASDGAWKTEHDAITKILAETVEGCSFTLHDFWTHTLRREELETAHIIENAQLREVSAAAHRALLDETRGDLAAVLTAIEDAVAQGQIDLRAGTFQPKFNPTYAKLHYVKFGGSSIVQHTTTASRQLQYHHASSPEEVAALANLYFAAKPMSSKLNYASPYTLRRSLVGLCAAYGVDTTHAAQRPFLLSAANLAKAEGIIGRVAQAAAVPFGVARRAEQRKLRADHQRLLSPVSKVAVQDPVSELLPTGADASAIAQAPKAEAAAKSWPLGAVKAVTYHWPTPQLEKLKFIRQAGSAMTAARVAELAEQQQKGRLEFSLWRKRSPQEKAAAKAAAEAAAAEVANLTKTHAELAEVQAYATQLYSRLSSSTPSAGAGAAHESEEDWVFAVMLNDAVALSEEESTQLYLPYKDAEGRPLPQGEYRLRVRAYDLSSGGSSGAAAAAVHPAMCSEAFSAPFPVFDALPQLVEQFFKQQQQGGGSKAAVEVFEGKDIVPFCEFLRAGGLDVPLAFEFEVGQGLDVDGNVPMSRFTALLQGGAFHASLAEQGVTDVQREIEPRCRAHWSLYNPGATAEEWAVARRDVLNDAVSRQREWWLPDPLLNPGDIVTGPSSDSGVSPASYPSTARYGTSLCTVLQAAGSSLEGTAAAPAAPGSVDKRLRAECAVDGTGAVTSLQFTGPATDISIDDALSAACAAVQRAQDRHSTLSMFKLADFEKAAQVMGFCGAHGQEFGGKYARTYCYAVDKAKQEMANTLVSGRVLLGVDDGEKERLSEAEKVDRFASSTHPELRKRQFYGRVTEAGQGLEDPTPDQTSTWNQ